ncbi:Pentatricopeptide repeat-containing protein, mitochondrial [Symbiodinium microadriaticum]|uniref:Pentatricopeptide repeat-containing protein, mitochondrial n=1 Tax=Symbiodinium microadriaticum TaxID=2951 RepID=A0A1Q9DL26_SYMMI|nr:Pentatricopeptide repeat-containing protein, mitochondrial [Symbiodinium microadriaticum]
MRLRPDTLTHGIAVGTCRSHLQWQWCLVCALDACLRYPGQPLAALYNGAMVACCDAGEQKLLPRLLREAREVHVELDVISFNTCISASEKLTKWPLSLQLLQVTYSTRLQADSTTYEAAITSCEQGSSWTYGLRLLMQLRMKATPTVSSFNAVMGSEMRVRWSEALQLFAELRANQQLPDMITHAALSSALQGSHQWKLLSSNLPHVRAEAMARLRVKNQSAPGGTCRLGATGLQEMQLVDKKHQQRQVSNVSALQAEVPILSRLEIWPPESPHWRVAGPLIVPQNLREQELVQMAVRSAAVVSSGACERLL